jgi:hypothetical protein
MNMKNKIMPYVLLGIIFILVALLINDHSSGKNISAIISKHGYTLTPSESKIVNVVVRDEVTSILNGYETLLQLGIPAVSVRQVALNYNENQVAADELYYNKTILLTGRIASINSGLGNEPYLTLYGINPFLPTSAHFQEGNTSRIAQLRRNQPIKLICKGGGAVIGTPIFSECAFTDSYLEREILEVRNAIDKFLRGEKIINKSIVNVAIAAISVSRILPETSTCFNSHPDTKSCTADMIKATKKNPKGKELFTDKINIVAKELKASGIDFPDLKRR